MPLTRSSEAPPGDGGERDGAGAHPDDHDQGGRPLVAHLDRVVERVRDGPVPGIFLEKDEKKYLHHRRIILFPSTLY